MTTEKHAYDQMTDAEAEAEIDRLYADNPDLVGAIIDLTLEASPLAGPIRILREIEGDPS